MNTIIEYKDGHSETTEDAAPSIDPETGELMVTEADNTVIFEEPLTFIARVIFEND